jgi:hypothetical protein
MDIEGDVFERQEDSMNDSMAEYAGMQEDLYNDKSGTDLAVKRVGGPSGNR